MQVEQIIIVFHILIALSIVGLILLQQGKGADMGASFGAGSSQTIFGGAGGGNLLTRATSVLAALFFTTSFALAIVAKNQAGGAGLIDIDAPLVVEGAALVPGDGARSVDIDSEIPEVRADLDGVGEDVLGADVPDADIPGIE